MEYGILFSNEKKWALKLWKDMEETYKPITKVEETNLKRLCAVRFPSWKRWSYRDSKKISGWHGGEKGQIGLEQDFQVSENTVCDISALDVRHYTFVQTHLIYNTMRTGWLWCTNVGSFLVTNVSSDVDDGETMACVGGRGCMEK